MIKIIKDQNNVSLFAGKNLELTAAGLISPDWTAPGITTATHTIEEVESLPDGWIGGHYYRINGDWPLTPLGQAVKAKELESAKEDLKDQVDHIRYSKIYMESIPYTFSGDTDPDGVQMRNEIDRQNIQDTVAEALLCAPDDMLYFMPVSNNLKAMTAAQVKAMGRYLKDRGNSIMAKSWNLKSEIAETSTMEELADIDINAGWPE